MSISLECEFWAVGQGLFSSGKIVDFNNYDTVFSWVYDCGTSSRKQFLQNAISQMTSQLSQPHIDLLVISHFDRDHISGLSDLLRQKSAQYWLLPYAPLWQRLLILFMQDGDISEEMFEMYSNPIQYLAQHYADDIQGKTILLVQSSDKVIQPLENSNNNEFIFETLEDISDEFIRDELAQWAENSLNFEVKMLDPTQPMYYQGVEFIPYNEPLSNLSKQPQNLVQFQRDVLAIVNDPTLSTQDKIKDLRSFYDQHFGSNSINRNIISLFLYVGKVLPNKGKKTAILYCGDGNLNNSAKVDQLENVMSHSRMENIHCFQVPHHGAEGNSYNGLACRIQPDISVFSARPDDRRYGHPSALVLRDFAAFRPNITDTNHPIHISL